MLIAAKALIALLVLHLGGHGSPLWSQGQKSSLSQLPIVQQAAEHLRPEDGLAHGSVRAIVQDQYGLIWLGTEGGLQRYDGVTFETFTDSPTSRLQLSDSRVQALTLDSSGNLWVGTPGGLDVLDPRRSKATAVRTPEGEPLAVLRVGYSEAIGVVVSTAKRGLLRVERTASGWAVVQFGPSTMIGAELLHEVSDAGVYVVTEGMAWELDRTGRVVRQLATDTDSVRFLAVGSDGNLQPLLASVFMESQKVEVLQKSPGLSGRLVVAETGFEEKSSWVATLSGLLYWNAATERLERRRLGGNAAVLGLSPSGDLLGLEQEALAVMRDRDGAVWVGTYAGLFRIDHRRNSFDSLYRQDGSKFDQQVSSFGLVGRELFVGTYGAGLFRFNFDRRLLIEAISIAKRSEGLCSDYIWSIAPFGPRSLIIGTNGAVCRWHEDGRVDVVFEPGGNVRGLMVDDRQRIWVASTAGVFSIEQGKAHRWSENVAGKVLGLPDGTLLIMPATQTLSPTPSLLHLDPSSGLTTEVSLPEGLILYDVLSTSAGDRLWLASGSGLFVMDRQTGETEQVQLPSQGTLPISAVFSASQPRGGEVWLGTNRGLVRVRYDASRMDRLEIESVDAFNSADGVASVEFNRRAQTLVPGLRRPDLLASDVLVIGGMSGVALFDPASIGRREILPEPIILRATIEGAHGERVIDVPTGLKMDRFDHVVTFEFTTPSYTRASQNRFRYRLVGAHEDWVDTTERRSSRYVGLPPGRHTFEVAAANGNGPWSASVAHIPVRVVPPYWATWWFRGAALLSLLGLAMTLYRRRVARLLELERMRLRIAGDLHDELGSELSGIAFASSVMSSSEGLGEVERQRLTEIAETARGVMEGLRDIVWYVNPEHDGVTSLVDRMRSTATRLAPQMKLDFRAEVGTRTLPLDMHQRRQVHLIFKELVTNAARHSQGQTLQVQVAVADAVLEVQVADDGTGIGARASDGSGLESVKRRALEIGAQLDHKETARGSAGDGGVVATDQAATGTRWILSMPLRVDRVSNQMT